MSTCGMEGPHRVWSWYGVPGVRYLMLHAAHLCAIVCAHAPTPSFDHAPTGDSTFQPRGHVLQTHNTHISLYAMYMERGGKHTRAQTLQP